ncbi:MAG TPA: cation diffusion facilitator family transporter [Gemmatimonadaceae bacterium]|nr:cation diffusion facilitator family transporter [Gemmatimonadaceae bacterium]
MNGSREGLTRFAQAGVLVNALLAAVKGVAGVLGNSYALVADAIESSADVLSSFIVWSGLRIAAREADDDFPFGYGKAEALAAVMVTLFLVAAAVGIAIEAVREIRTPHHAPAPYTLVVLVAVVLVKAVLFRRVRAAGDAAGSTALSADAWHHGSDAITSLAAFIGISIALIKGPGWESADDWGALVAACVILYTAARTLRPAVLELMDRAPSASVRSGIETAVHSVSDVRGMHRLRVRRTGGAWFIALDVQADAQMTLHDAHIVSGKVKSAIRAALGEPASVVVHMEPDDAER